MMKQRETLVLLMAFSAIIGGLACSWTDKDSEEFAAMLLVGTIIGALFSIISIVVACVPLCIGKMKPQAKIIAGIVIAVGIICCFVPAIAGKAQGDAAVVKSCDRCVAQGSTPCSEDDKTKLKEAVGALGIFFAYTVAYGFVVVILGITAAALGCCICCKCCKMKDEEGAAGGGQPAVVGQVVGQPC